MNKTAVVQELVKVAGLLVTASGYQRLIETELKKLNRSDVDPRHVEAYMRVENRTLDNLSPSQFRQEVKKSVEAVDEGGVAMAERVTKSYGL